MIAAVVADGAVTAAAAVTGAVPAEEAPDHAEKRINSHERPDLVTTAGMVVRCESGMINLQCRGTQGNSDQITIEKSRD
jgi:hypothetical protein